MVAISDVVPNAVPRRWRAFSIANEFRCRLAAVAYRSSFIGTESVNRQQQYKKYHSGASFPVKINMFRSFDFVHSGKLVDRALNLRLLVRDTLANSLRSVQSKGNV